MAGEQDPVSGPFPSSFPCRLLIAVDHQLVLDGKRPRHLARFHVGHDLVLFTVDDAERGDPTVLLFLARRRRAGSKST